MVAEVRRVRWTVQLFSPPGRFNAANLGQFDNSIGQVNAVTSPGNGDTHEQDDK